MILSSLKIKCESIFVTTLVDIRINCEMKHLIYGAILIIYFNYLLAGKLLFVIF